MRRYEIVGSRATKIGVKTKKVMGKTIFLGASNIIDVTFKLSIY